MLDLFFHCLDDRTAQDLRLIDNGVSASTLSSQLIKGSQLPDSTLHTPCSATDQPLSPNSTDDILPVVQPTGALNQIEDAAVNMDWYELFNVEGDDISGLAGSLTNPDYLNPQNLEFLYRFL